MNTSPILSVVAEMYARSLFELAEKAGNADEIRDELNQLVELLADHAGLWALFEHKAIDGERRAATLRKLFEGRASQLTVNFLLVLNDKGRLGELPAIRIAYDLALKSHLGEIDVEVQSAVALTDQQEADVASRISGAIGAKASIATSVDPALIGGLKIRIQDRLIDASVASRLRKLSDQVIRAGREKLRYEDNGETPETA
jgi:F-type H+-transporting ATPase subunit delta